MKEIPIFTQASERRKAWALKLIPVEPHKTAEKNVTQLSKLAHRVQSAKSNPNQSPTRCCTEPRYQLDTVLLSIVTPVKPNMAKQAQLHKIISIPMHKHI